ncbi:MAG: SDR family NAD(P)-dependent oxidoreductase [Chloroflexi bacterium]|nr:SDR family NAD(P)-dependent oxidoreductase [Chloroflexota bacterium]
MGKVALVTGGAGFIGSHLAEALCERGYHVRVFDSLIKGKKSSIDTLIDEGKIEFIEGDIRSKDLVSKATKGTDVVFHTAGIHIQRSLASPEAMIQVNIQGSYNVFRAALDHGVERVIFSSSSSIYGDPVKLPMSEIDPPNPAEPYGAGKWMCEQLLNTLAKEGLKFNALRYFNVYGERQAAHAFYTTVISAFIKRLMAGEAPVIDGEGSQSMDFTHVSDVAKANIAAMECAAENEVFNVGTGISTTVRDLAVMLAGALEVRVEPICNGRPTLVSRRQADTTKAEELMGFKAEMPVQEGLTQVAQAIAAHPERY